MAIFEVLKFLLIFFEKEINIWMIMITCKILVTRNYNLKKKKPNETVPINA